MKMWCELFVSSAFDISAAKDEFMSLLTSHQDIFFCTCQISDLGGDSDLQGHSFQDIKEKSSGVIQSHSSCLQVGYEETGISPQCPHSALPHSVTPSWTQPVSSDTWRDMNDPVAFLLSLSLSLLHCDVWFDPHLIPVTLQPENLLTTET